MGLVHILRDCVRWLAVVSIACVAGACGADSATSVVTVVAPSSVCSVSLSTRSVGVDAAAVDGQLTVSLNRECQWAAKSDVDWIGLTPQGGQGDSTITYAVRANSAAIPRRATISINDQPIDVTQAGAPCKFSVSPASASVEPTGGRVTVSVTAQADCSWSGASQASWISIVEGGSTHSGDGTLILRVDANGPTPRSGSVTIADQVVTISQPALPAQQPAPTAPCAFTLLPSAQTMAAAGGTGTVSVDGPAGCGWSAVSNASWIAITAGSNGTGTGAVQYHVGANPATSARSGSIVIAGHEFTVNQQAAAPAQAPCTFGLSATSQSVDPSGGSGQITVTASAATCGWTASTTTSWLTVSSGASGIGNGTMTYVAAANPTNSQRNGTLTVAGETVTVTQAAAAPPPAPAPPTPCTYSLSASSQSVPATGGSGAVTVTASAGSCAWTTTGAPTWVTITGGARGEGTGTVQFTVAANTAPTPRTATLTIGGRTFEISQVPATAPCTFSLSAPSQSVPATGGPGTVTVTASAGSCAWAATGAPTWVTITAGGSGTGTGTVRFTVAANTSAAPRTATLTIGGQTFTIPQAAAPAPCTFTVSPASQPFNAGAATGQVTVTASTSTCAWTASPGASWLTISSGASGTGNGTTKFGVAANTTSSPRTGTLTVAGQPVSIIQTGQPIAVSGRLSGKAGTCPNLTFSLDGRTIKTNATTAFSSSCDKLKNNDKMEVTGLIQSDGSVLASTLRPD